MTSSSFCPTVCWWYAFIGQAQPKAKGQGSLGDAGHKNQFSSAKIREEKGRKKKCIGDDGEYRESVTCPSAVWGTQGKDQLCIVGQYARAVLHSVSPQITLKYFLYCACPTISCWGYKNSKSSFLMNALQLCMEVKIAQNKVKQKRKSVILGFGSQ